MAEGITNDGSVYVAGGPLWELFDHVIVLDYYDGPVGGIAIVYSQPLRVYWFDLLNWDNAQDLHVFRFCPSTLDTFRSIQMSLGQEQQTHSVVAPFTFVNDPAGAIDEAWRAFLPAKCENAIIVGWKKSADRIIRSLEFSDPTILTKPLLQCFPACSDERAYLDLFST